MPMPAPASLRIVAFAYHDMGTVCLQELVDQGARLAAVVTHRDDPREAVWFASVAEWAAAHGLPVHTPEDPNTPDFVAQIRALRPDLLFSCYYRRLLIPALLEVPRLGAVNLHGSLLPKYRGRAPLNWVLVRGETVTGVTLHYMDARADHGDIIGQRSVPIAIEDTALSLWRKLTAAGRALLAEQYPLIAAGDAPRIPQAHAAASTFGRRTPADGLIEWRRPAREIYNLIRAVTHPFPGAFTHCEGRKTVLWSARPPAGEATVAPTGTLLGPGEGGALRVAAGDGVLEILRLQAEGEPEVSGIEFWRAVAVTMTRQFASPDHPEPGEARSQG
jgi:methionyl-tRNA formyltransferase